MPHSPPDWLYSKAQIEYGRVLPLFHCSLPSKIHVFILNTSLQLLWLTGIGEKNILTLQQLMPWCLSAFAKPETPLSPIHLNGDSPRYPMITVLTFKILFHHTSKHIRLLKEDDVIKICTIHHEWQLILSLPAYTLGDAHFTLRHSERATFKDFSKVLQLIFALLHEADRRATSPLFAKYEWEKTKYVYLWKHLEPRKLSQGVYVVFGVQCLTLKMLT